MKLRASPSLTASRPPHPKSRTFGRRFSTTSSRHNRKADTKVASPKHPAGDAVKKGRRKRLRDTNRAEDISHDEDPYFQKPQKQNFACPFYKLDPFYYQDCIHLKLQRISDVKQHLKRRHSLPQHQCPSCLQAFSSKRLISYHVQDDGCERPGFPLHKRGVSPEKQEVLAHRVPRSLEPVDQWMKIWSILFDDKPCPEDPHLGTVVEEVFGMLRHFWKREGSPTASTFVKDEKDVPELLKRILDEAQDHFKQRSDGPEFMEAFNERSGSNSRMIANASGLVNEPPPDSVSVKDESQSYRSIDSVQAFPSLPGPCIETGFSYGESIPPTSSPYMPDDSMFATPVLSGGLFDQFMNDASFPGAILGDASDGLDGSFSLSYGIFYDP